MGSVRALYPEPNSVNGSAFKLERFFEYVYRDETGYVYSPTKDPVSERWELNFFQWPTECNKLLEHVVKNSINQEVYYGPALFDRPSAEKSAFKGTGVVWAEFDGSLPNGNTSYPKPSLKIRSSTPGHEHWYWKLRQFTTDITQIESITQRLAYHLNADIGCWNANRVLRPPGTRHHLSRRLVEVIDWQDHTTDSSAFQSLPKIPAKVFQDNETSALPAVLEVIAKYQWESQQFQFFLEKEIEKGHRSSALTKLGYICLEMGMSNAETLSILLNADSRWGKFKDRKDQRKWLVDIINYCRIKNPSKQEAKPTEQVKQAEEKKKSRLKVYSYGEFLKTDIKLEWVIPNLIHRKGLVSLSGPPDVGKSQLSLRFAERLAKGESFLKWRVPKPVRMLFVSMEMPSEELRYLFDQMKMEENDLLRDNFLILPIGSSLRLSNRIARQHLNEVVEEFKPDGIILDSLGVAINDDISSEKIILDTFNYVNETLRGHFGCFVWFIHHHRKGQVGNRKPNKLDDLFGSQYIGAALTTALGLWPVGSEIEINCLKLRMSEKFKSFRIHRVPGIDFNMSDAIKTATGSVFGGLGSNI